MTDEEFEHRMVAVVANSEDFEIWQNKSYSYDGLLVDLNRCINLLKRFSMTNKFFLKLQIKNFNGKDNNILNIVKEYLQEFEYQILERQTITEDFYSVTVEFTKLPQSTIILSKL